jgi:hypothetical protein
MGVAASDGPFGADFAALSAGNYSSGDGTAENPYRIANIFDLMELTNSPDDWGKSFLMTADIDCIGVAIAPIGSYAVPFTGIFDGAGHVISNLTINKPTQNYVGLFGYVDSGGQIKNLGVVNVNVIGDRCVGGLAGYNEGGTLTSCYAAGSVYGTSIHVGGLVGRNSGTLTSCYATGSVDGTIRAGGLAGGNFGALISCYATGSVTGSSSVGGLAGGNFGVLISCYATGAVTGSNSVGGLVGLNWQFGTLTSCYATGSVNGEYEVGGLAGSNYGVLISCYATGAVTGEDDVGGLVGWNAGAVPASYYSTDFAGGTYYAGGLVELNDDGTLISCYATGSVTGTDCVGGLVGYNDLYGALTSCYATGSVNGEDYVGGLVGYNGEGTLTSCFWDVDTSGLLVGVGFDEGQSAGVTGKSTMEMQTLATFTDVGWDFTDETVNGTNDYWRMCADGADYPRLRWEYSTIGDFACPDSVNLEDLCIYLDGWLMDSCGPDNDYCDGVDLDHSGSVDIKDFSILSDHWMASLRPIG